MQRKLVYIMSLRNASADLAGQWIDYKGEKRYMKSPLEYLVEELNGTELGNQYHLTSVIYDDDIDSTKDQEKVKGYGFKPSTDQQWIYPQDLTVQGQLVNDIFENIPSTYRKLALDDPNRKTGKHEFEMQLLKRLNELDADIVVLDGLILILDELIRPGATYHNKVINIHPGVTRAESPYVRRGATATLDALYGARGEKITNYATQEKVATTPLFKTGASLHYVDNGIDSGPVIWDALNTPISPDDNILELRWNNFNLSLFPALSHGLAYLAGKS